MTKQLMTVVTAIAAMWLNGNAAETTLASGPWELTVWGNVHTVDASAFNSIETGDRLTLSYSGNGQAQIYAPKTDNVTDANDTGQACHLYTTVTGEYNYADFSGSGTVEITLTSEMTVNLKTRGLRMEGKDMQLSDLRHLTTDPVTVEGRDGRLGGRVISSAPQSDYDGAQVLFDDNANTWFSSAQTDRAWAGLDLGQPYIIDKVEWQGNGNADVILGIIEGANNADFSDALPLLIIRDNEKSSLRSAEITCSRGMRYVRYVGPRGSRARLSELHFSGTPGAGDDSQLTRLTNLPVIVINTVDMEEPWDYTKDPDKNHDIKATISVIDSDGKLLSASGTTRERGNWSRVNDKKPYRIKFDKKQQLLGSPAKAKKWNLLNNAGDKTLMRNMLAFDVARKFNMRWVAYCTPVDLIINGEYRGCYQLTDNIENKKNRMDISNPAYTDAEGEPIQEIETPLADGAAPETGPYFFEIDAYAYGIDLNGIQVNSEPEQQIFTSRHYQTPVTVKSPESSSAEEDWFCDARRNYLIDHFNEVEKRLKEGTTDASGRWTYREKFDVSTFVQHLLVNEVAANRDCFWSTNMYKIADDEQIHTGPVWDFDVAFDNNTWMNNSFDSNRPLFIYMQEKEGNGGEGHEGASIAGGMRDFANRIIFDDPHTMAGTDMRASRADDTEKGEVYTQWGMARERGLSSEWLKQQADDYASYLSEAQALNFTRWDINSAGQGYPAPAGSYSGEVSRIKNHVDNVFTHLDSNIGYTPGEFEVTTGIGTPAADSVVRVSIDGIVSASEAFDIYTVGGLRIASLRDGRATAPLAPGIYIVKTRSGCVKKVAVR